MQVSPFHAGNPPAELFGYKIVPPIARKLIFFCTILVIGILLSLPDTALRAAQPLLYPPQAPVASKVRPGIDVLREWNFSVLKGKRIGLLTNQAGVDSNGRSTIDILREAPEVRLVALFAPEHGIYGDVKANEYVPCQTDLHTGLPVYSLYGKTRRPTHEMLAGIDSMVVDLQDLGVRSYTYISALRYVMEECFKTGKEVIILDRPNPMGGLKVDGPLVDRKLMSYVGAYPIPYVYGLTIGELATMAKGTPGWLELTEKQRRHGRLIVVPMSGWRRDMRWENTGLTWRQTSPYIRDLPSAQGYAMTGLGCMIGGFTHGLGTNFPFRVIGYSGRSPEQILAALEAEHIPGLKFRIITVVNNDGKKTRGVYVSVSNWNRLRPTEISFHLMRLAARWAREAHRENPFATANANDALLFNKHTGSQQFWNSLVRAGERVDVEGYVAMWQKQALEFQQQSRRFWLYK